MKKQFYLDESDKLDNIYDAPEGYFEHFPQKMHKRIQQSKGVPVWTSYLLPKYALVITSIVIVLVAGIVFMNISQEKVSSVGDLDISAQEIKAYLLQNEIHEYDLVNFYLTNEEAEDEEAIFLEEEILDDNIDIEEIVELL
jgi:hypothetical protein